MITRHATRHHDVYVATQQMPGAELLALQQQDGAPGLPCAGATPC